MSGCWRRGEDFISRSRRSPAGEESEPPPVTGAPLRPGFSHPLEERRDRNLLMRQHFSAQSTLRAYFTFNSHNPAALRLHGSVRNRGAEKKKKKKKRNAEKSSGTESGVVFVHSDRLH